jgi:hypothetical protein
MYPVSGLEAYSITVLWYYAINETVNGPVCRSEIIWLYNNRRIFYNTKVWKSGMSDWITYDQTDLIENVITPPPLHKAKIDNSSIWLVAFMPLISFVFRIFLMDRNSVLSLFLLCCIGLVSIAICIIDERTIKKLGYDTKELLVWAILLIPVYLFRRAYLLRQRMDYAITWLVLYLISLFINFCIIIARLP